MVRLNMRAKRLSVIFLCGVASLAPCSQGSGQAPAAPSDVRRIRFVKNPDPVPAFTLRDVDGKTLSSGELRGKVTLLNFWATWCGPCHALEPIYEKLAGKYLGNANVVFLSANCDEDESLVGPYLAERKPHSNEVFADGLEELYGVDSFPTVVILDRGGKVVFRANGFDPETIEQELGEAVQQAAAVTARAEKPESPVAH